MALKWKDYHIIQITKSKGMKINENFNIKQIYARLLSEHPLGISLDQSKLSNLQYESVLI